MDFLFVKIVSYIFRIPVCTREAGQKLVICVG